MQIRLRLYSECFTHDFSLFLFFPLAKSMYSYVDVERISIFQAIFLFNGIQEEVQKFWPGIL